MIDNPFGVFGGGCLDREEVGIVGFIPNDYTDKRVILDSTVEVLIKLCNDLKSKEVHDNIHDRAVGQKRCEIDELNDDDVESLQESAEKRDSEVNKLPLVVDCVLHAEHSLLQLAAQVHV